MNSSQRQDLSVVLMRLVHWRRDWSPADWQEACDRVRLELLDRQQQADQPAPTETAVELIRQANTLLSRAKLAPDEKPQPESNQMIITGYEFWKAVQSLSPGLVGVHVVEMRKQPFGDGQHVNLDSEGRIHVVDELYGEGLRVHRVYAALLPPDKQPSDESNQGQKRKPE